MKVSSELAHVRRAWGASVRDVANAISDVSWVVSEIVIHTANYDHG